MADGRAGQAVGRPQVEGRPPPPPQPSDRWPSARRWRAGRLGNSVNSCRLRIHGCLLRHTRQMAGWCFKCHEPTADSNGSANQRLPKRDDVLTAPPRVLIPHGRSTFRPCFDGVAQRKKRERDSSKQQPPQGVRKRPASPTPDGVSLLKAEGRPGRTSQLATTMTERKGESTRCTANPCPRLPSGGPPPATAGQQPRQLRPRAVPLALRLHRRVRRVSRRPTAPSCKPVPPPADPRRSRTLGRGPRVPVASTSISSTLLYSLQAPFRGCWGIWPGGITHPEITPKMWDQA
eukprot:gene5347-biopygen4203